MMFDLSKYQSAMEQAVAHFTDELKKVRTGRAHPDMLSGVKAEVYGQLSPLKQIANVTASDAQTLLITPFDPGSINAIANAIRADVSLGLNPADDGRVIRVPIPPLTAERRAEIAKTAHTKVENSKITLRNLREDARKALKAEKLPEDVVKTTEKEIDKLVQTYSAQLEEQFKIKEQEIMKI